MSDTYSSCVNVEELGKTFFYIYNKTMSSSFVLHIFLGITAIKWFGFTGLK